MLANRRGGMLGLGISQLDHRHASPIRMKSTQVRGRNSFDANLG